MGEKSKTIKPSPKDRRKFRAHVRKSPIRQLFSCLKYMSPYEYYNLTGFELRYKDYRHEEK